MAWISAIIAPFLDGIFFEVVTFYKTVSNWLIHYKKHASNTFGDPNAYTIIDYEVIKKLNYNKRDATITHIITRGITVAIHKMSEKRCVRSILWNR